MKRKHIDLFFIGIFFICCLIHSTSAGVLHWLSQVESDAGEIINNGTFTPKISTNGRYIAYGSAATNLIAEDNNQSNDIFLKDLVTGETQSITRLVSGQQFYGFFSQFSRPTSDGRYVAFVSSDEALPNGTGFADDYIYLKDLVTGALTNLSGYDSGLYFDLLYSFDLSDDAQFITFTTYDQIDPLHVDFEQQVYRKDLSTQNIELLSVSEDGTAMADDDCILVAVSDNNRYVLFRSEATNLTNDLIGSNIENFFVRDTTTQTTTLINITPNGDPSTFDNSATIGDVSNTGAVAFFSTQSDLITDDTNSMGDVFINNNGVIERITEDFNGNQISDGFGGMITINGEGTRVVFNHTSAFLVANDNNERSDIFAYQVAGGNISIISKNSQNEAANDYSISPDISLTGARMVYSSGATDLTNAPTSDLFAEIFVHQFSSQTTQKVSVPAFNPDTLVDRIPQAFGSSDQQTVIYSTRSNNLTEDPLNLIDEHLYLLDRTDNKHELLTSNGTAEGISPSGRYVVFTSNFAQPAGDIDLGAEHVFLLDRNSGSFLQIDEGFKAKVNNDGSVVFITKKAISNNDLNSTDDIYVFSADTQLINLVSEDMNGFAAIGAYPDIGGTGNNTWVVFSSFSDLLVPADTNGLNDVFIKKLPNGAVTRISQTTAGLEGNGSSTVPNVSANGNFVSFLTDSTNLTADDYSNAGGSQILRYDRVNNSLSLASINDVGLPLYAENSSLFFSHISDSGRYVTYGYEDQTDDGIDFLGDDDGQEDVVLFDNNTQVSRIVSKTAAGQNSLATVGYYSPVMEDLSVSPALVGVLFTASSPADLTGISHHPGHQEAFLYQQGGPDLNFTVEIIGPGEVNGTSSISCQTNCNYTFPLGTELIFTATADNGMQFQGWQVDFGACHDDTNPCELIIDREKTLTAVFIDLNELIFTNGFESVN